MKPTTLTRMASSAGIETASAMAGEAVTIDPQFDISDEGHLVFTWPPEDGVSITVKYPDRKGLDLKALMLVRWEPTGQDSMPLLTTNINFFSASSKKSAERSLAERLDREWKSRLEHIGAVTNSHHASGDPPEWLEQIELDSGVIKFHIPPILEAGEHTILFGDGNSGKSTFGLALALSVAHGIDLIPGIQADVRCRALYLDWETNKYTHARRERSLLAGINADLPNRQVLYKRMMSPLADAASEIASLVKAHGIGLLIIDSGGMASGGEISDEPAVARMFMAARLTGCTVLTITHVPKENKGKPIGSSFWWNQARACWEITHDQQESENFYVLGLSHRKHNNQARQPALAYRVEFNEENHIRYSVTNPAANPTLNETLSLPRRIEHFLLSHPWTTAAEIAGALSKKTTQVHDALSNGLTKSKESMSARFVRKGPKGHYIWAANHDGFSLGMESESTVNREAPPLIGGADQESRMSQTKNPKDPEALPW